MVAWHSENAQKPGFPKGQNPETFLATHTDREDRIHNEAIVDTRPEEQAMSWYHDLEGKISCPFRARCLDANAVSLLRKGEAVPDASTKEAIGDYYWVAQGYCL